MNRLEKIIRKNRPGPALHFRQRGYGVDHAHEFLCDLLALANTDCEGSRLIVLGVAPGPNGGRRFSPAHPQDHAPLSYEKLAAEYIEPALRLKYREIDIDGVAIGVLHIADCHDRPYMLRIDHSAALRRGDAYLRVGTRAVKMGRAQLEKIFASRFRDAAPARSIEVGFAGDYIVKDWVVPTVDLEQLPSAVAKAKLRELIDAQESATGTGSTTVVARLTHARLFGSDQPYQPRTRAELMKELVHIGEQMWGDDQKHLYSLHGQALDLVLLNQGDDAIDNVEVEITLPVVDGLLVANPVVTPLVAAPGYPKIVFDSKEIRISGRVDSIAPGSPTPLFENAARFAVSAELAGQSVAVHYTLTANNIDAPISGQLRLSFATAA